MEERERRTFVLLCGILREKGLIDGEEEQALKTRLNREEMEEGHYGKGRDL